MTLRAAFASLALAAAPAGGCGDGGSMADSVASSFQKDCLGAPAPDPAMRAHLKRLCTCSAARIRASGIRFGDSERSITQKVEAASAACLAEIGGAPGEARDAEAEAPAKAPPAG
ncbi:MAG TPA: hypothetical protein VF759_05305 [Allosphingosinicella sp.]